jgi:parallel beta-helix repeat protein
LLVDDDHMQCPDAQFTTIQAAVLAALPGDTVRVCAGVYSGPVEVNKPLTLLGSQPRNAKTRVAATPDPTQEAIVSGMGASSAFDLTAGNTTLDGFYVTNSDAIFQGGINVESGSGYNILDNVVANNSVGMYLSSDGATPSVVERNAFVSNNAGGFPSPNTGTGIDGRGPLVNTEIDHNFFQGNSDSAINLPGSTGGLIVDHNDSVSDATLLVLGESTGATVAHNTSTDTTQSALYLFGNTQLSVIHNDLAAGPSDTAGSGIASAPPGIFGPGANTNINIGHNNVNGFKFGLNLQGLVASTVNNNSVTGAAVYGVNLASGSNNNTINNNRSDSNQQGFRLAASSVNNTLTSNRASNNTLLDCNDQSKGPGTSGTADFWFKDKGDTANPPGICK